ncbi:MAG: glycine/betaine ABC transporter, partial [Microbacterium sp. 14-71-5]
AEFLRLQAEIGKTIIFVTHDFDEAVRLGDRIAVLSDRSRIEQFDTPANILAAPANEYVSSFIGQGAAIKRLALMPVTDAKLAPVAGAGDAPRMPSTGTLRDALDLIVLSGSSHLTVTDPDGVPMGSLDHAAISAVLGTTVPVASTNPVSS